MEVSSARLSRIQNQDVTDIGSVSNILGGCFSIKVFPLNQETNAVSKACRVRLPAFTRTTYLVGLLQISRLSGS